VTLFEDVLRNLFNHEELVILWNW